MGWKKQPPGYRGGGGWGWLGGAIPDPAGCLPWAVSVVAAALAVAWALLT